MENEVLEKLIRKVISSIKQNENGKKLLIFSGGSRYQLDRFFVEAQQICGRNLSKIAVDDTARRFVSESRLRGLKNVTDMYGFDESDDPEEIFDGVDLAVIGSMDIGTASKISVLSSDSLSARLASFALQNRIRLLSNDFSKEFESGNKGYYAAVKKLAETLQSFGVEFVPAGEIKKSFGIEAFGGPADAGELKLVTEKFIKEYRGGELRIQNDTVITPLAKDEIRERKIVISRE